MDTFMSVSLSLSQVLAYAATIHVHTVRSDSPKVVPLLCQEYMI